jgi:hypothetical protein
MQIEMPGLRLFGPPDVLLAFTIHERAEPTLRPLFEVTIDLIVQGKIQRLPRTWVRPTLDMARKVIPPGLACFARNPEDEPAIVETWL